MTPEDLKLHDGSTDKPAYIAYKGVVYDVSKSARWAGGVHMARHKAGADMTGLIELAPHGEEMLKRLERAGDLDAGPAIVEEGHRARLRELYRTFHPHPVTIHFPIGMVFFAALMQGAAILTGKAAYGTSALYAMLAGTLFMLPAVGAGMLSWWINYDSAFTPIFRKKIAGTAVLLFTATGACLTGISTGTASGMFTALVFASTGAVLFIAQNGGKLTWPQT
jgi:predicted heme/steroid binding protein/uncharacterized membrane protein